MYVSAGPTLPLDALLLNEGQSCLYAAPTSSVLSHPAKLLLLSCEYCLSNRSDGPPNLLPGQNTPLRTEYLLGLWGRKAGGGQEEGRRRGEEGEGGRRSEGDKEEGRRREGAEKKRRAEE